MTEAIQENLPMASGHGVSEETIAELCSWLRARGWQTRKQICDGLGWEERRVRDVAEALGAEVVRGQAGFKLTDMVEREELGLALQAAEAHLSQARKMTEYGLALKRRLHGIVGGQTQTQASSFKPQASSEESAALCSRSGIGTTTLIL